MDLSVNEMFRKGIFSWLPQFLVTVRTSRRCQMYRTAASALQAQAAPSNTGKPEDRVGQMGRARLAADAEGDAIRLYQIIFQDYPVNSGCNSVAYLLSNNSEVCRAMIKQRFQMKSLFLLGIVLMAANAVASTAEPPADPEEAAIRATALDYI